MKELKPIILSIITIFAIVLLCSFTYYNKHKDDPRKEKEHPRIANIINFIRLLEPRDPNFAEDVLYQTVVKQVQMMRKYKLAGTFFKA